MQICIVRGVHARSIVAIQLTRVSTCALFRKIQNNNWYHGMSTVHVHVAANVWNLEYIYQVKSGSLFPHICV